MLDFIIDFITEIIIHKISRKTWTYIIVGVGLFVFIWFIFFK